MGYCIYNLKEILIENKLITQNIEGNDKYY
jgi:hypothetical protein